MRELKWWKSGFVKVFARVSCFCCSCVIFQKCNRNGFGIVYFVLIRHCKTINFVLVNFVFYRVAQVLLMFNPLHLDIWDLQKTKSSGFFIWMSYFLIATVGWNELSLFNL